MKRIYIYILIPVFFLTSCYDDSQVTKAFGKYSHYKGVTSVTIPGFAIDLFTMIAGVDEEIEDLLEDIDKVKILTIEDQDLNRKVNLHKEFYSDLAESSYEELMTVHDQNQDFSLYGKIDSDNIFNELIILVGGEENTIVYLRGQIEPKKLEKIINKSKSGDLLSFKDFSF